MCFPNSTKKNGEEHLIYTETAMATQAKRFGQNMPLSGWPIGARRRAIDDWALNQIRRSQHGCWKSKRK